MIFYDFKSLSRYPTISWTVTKTRNFLQTLEMKITTEIQQKVKLLHFLNEKVIFLTLTEKKNTISRQNWTRLHYWRVLECTFTDSAAETFLFENGTAIFQISLLIWASKITKMKLQTKELEK